MGYLLFSPLVQGARPALTPASTIPWVAVGLARNIKTTIRRILRLVSKAPMEK
jgi:hypothetical protein